MERLSHAVRSTLSWLRLSAYDAPFNLTRDMHHRRHRMFFFLFDDSVFECVEPAVAEWFRRNRIIYRLANKRSQWSPLPVFTRQRDVDAYVDLHETMTREYCVYDNDLEAELRGWFADNDILHIWDRRSVKNTPTFRLLDDRDAVHLALCYNIESRLDLALAQEKLRSEPARICDKGYFERIYRDKFIVKRQS